MQFRTVLVLVPLACTACTQSSQSSTVSFDAGPADTTIEDATAADTRIEPPSDAATDGSRDAEAGAAAWCASQGLHLFCDDFDEGPLAQFWDQIQMDHGMPKLDDTAYTSPLESFLAPTMALSEGAVAMVGLSKRVTYVATQMHLAFDLRVDAVGSSTSPVIVSQLQLLDMESDILEVVNLAVEGTSATVQDIAPPLDGGADWEHDHTLAPAPVLGQWVRLAIDIDLPGYDAGVGTGTLTVTVGNAETPSIDHALMSPTSQPAQPFFYLGVVSAEGPSQPITVRFDDVTFDVQP